VKVGYRQASYSEKTPYSDVRGFFTSAVSTGGAVTQCAPVDCDTCSNLTQACSDCGAAGRGMAFALT
jgi:hypothetical protein